jgi:hypothetical protein
MKATVLVPTHDHGPTLRYSVESALRQSEPDLEVFIVGDGVPDLAREVIAELTDQDPRVRFFDFPKGERHGEASRHLALQEARGEIVCYLSDDDLWFPEHVKRMHQALRRHNFVNALALCVHPDGEVGTWYGDLQHPYYRERLRGKWNFMPLSSVAHRADFYRTLPRGWHPAPPDIWTDLYLFQQILAHQAVDPLTLFEPSVAVFPTPMRRDWTIEARTRELEAWMPRILDADGRAELGAAFLRGALKDRAHAEAAKDTETAALRAGTERFAAECQALARDVQGLTTERDRLTGQIHELHQRLAARETALMDQKRRLISTQALLERVRAEVSVIRSSATWRARERLLASPLLRRPLIWLARALAPRSPRA